jgi:hypothetical protein
MATTLLIVLGRDLEPDRVSALLGIQPDQVWRRGERQSFKRKDGTILQFKTRHGRGGWKAWLKGAERKRSISAQVGLWCRRLSGKRGAVQELQKLGYSLIIDSCAAAPDFIHLSAELHRQLADLNVSLDITFFTGPQSPNKTRNVENAGAR